MNGVLLFSRALKMYVRQPTKAIIEYLRNNTGRQDIDQTEIMIHLRDYPQGSISHKMAALVSCKIVEERRQGKHVYYKINLNTIRLIDRAIEKYTTIWI